MYKIPKNKRKITAKIAVKKLAAQGVNLTYEEADMVLDIMYDFAKLALNQQLQSHSESQDRRFNFLDQDKKSR
jgi:hypothetical protein